MYLVHTWGKKYVPGTYRFMSESVYSGTMVHTGLYSVTVHTGMTLVHTL